MKTMPTLRQPELYNRAYVTIPKGEDDIFLIHEAGANIKDKLEKNGTDVARTRFSVLLEVTITRAPVSRAICTRAEPVSVS